VFVELAKHPEKDSKRSRRSAFGGEMKSKRNDISLHILKDELLSTKVFLKYISLSLLCSSFHLNIFCGN
jgi:hypothetical protein